MPLIAILAFLAAALAVGLGLGALLRSAKGIAPCAFTAGMVVLGVETFITALLLHSSDPQKALQWHNYRVWATSLLSGTWLLFSLSYARGNYRQFLAKWWPLLGIVFLLPIFLAIPFHGRVIVQWQRRVYPFDEYFGLTWPGIVLYSSFLLSAILILTHLERTLRTSVGTMRWRIKFIIIGLLLLFGVRIYTASQNLLYSSVSLNLQEIEAVALLIACGLISFSFLRAGLTKVDLYPSPGLLQGSATVLLAGIYLLLVGSLAQVITVIGGDAVYIFKVSFVLFSLALLGIILFSDRVRQKLKLFVSRNFQRPTYDYRQVWTTFAARTSFTLDNATLCQALVKWISETFNVLSVNIWLLDDLHPRFNLGASTALPVNQSQPVLSLDEQAPDTLERLKSIREPIDLDASHEPWLQSLKTSTQSFFPTGGKRLCLSIVGRGELVGILTLGDRVNGVPFTLEDNELLKCVAEQTAGHLLNIKLSKKLLQAREMEAFQTMAAFFVHDLKNVGSTLSLMLQNLGVHFDNPDFRKDALRSLSRSVERLNELISRLTLLRQQMNIKRLPADFNGVVSFALKYIEGVPNLSVVQELQPLPKVPLDSAQMQKVVTNLLLNAVEAVGPSGEIHVRTAERNGYACLSVQDNGTGMTPEFLAQSLFRPFQTTKKKGLGIGVFHSKMIVDAHGGKMEVESVRGKGTTFRVLIPLQPEC